MDNDEPASYRRSLSYISVDRAGSVGVVEATGDVPLAMETQTHPQANGEPTVLDAYVGSMDHGQDIAMAEGQAKRQTEPAPRVDELEPDSALDTAYSAVHESRSIEPAPEATSGAPEFSLEAVDEAEYEVAPETTFEDACEAVSEAAFEAACDAAFRAASEAVFETASEAMFEATSEVR